MTKRCLMIFIILIAHGISVHAYEWYASFEAGKCVPTESFDSIADDDTVYGLSIDYIPKAHLGVRVVYYHQEFQFDNRLLNTPLKIDSLGIWALLNYSFPEYFRFFAVVGPTYFSSGNTQNVLKWDHSGDIGWSSGAGLDFQPYQGWGIRFQSVYNSALFGRESPRASWVNSTIGMSFRF